MRRLAGFGWSIETASGEVRAIARDDGSKLRIVGRQVGTREAAQLLGVRPPNFVRDWASRSDFPAPVATLSSGRVWLATDVEAYAAHRRSAKADRGCIEEIARRIVWWQSPEMTLARPLDFVGRVMASGSLEEVRDVEVFFGRRSLREALSKASPGVFDGRAWSYWQLILGVDRTSQRPARHVP